jgi:succinoglycan biosynthesis protein ExoU
MTGAVGVIVAAHNAAATIGMAITSALAQSEVNEVIVVDDASTDATGTAALRAGGNDPRLVVMRQDRNIGPAAARNLAISQSSSPYIAVLDADDHLLRGRFAHLLARPDWDMTADNIAFVADTDTAGIPLDESDHGRAQTLDLASFVRGNITGNGPGRIELGFLKPLMRRDFLVAHNLAYDPGLRLGEDYDLYVRALQKGARFLMSRRVGYVARVRENSLSRQHGTADLRALLDACDRHIAAATAPATLSALNAHRRQLRARVLLRLFLDRKAEAGIAAALGFALRPPANFAPIALCVLADKMRAIRGIRPVDVIGHSLFPLID